MIEFGLLAISSFLNVLLGLLVFLKNPKSATNKLFLLLTSSFAVWSVVNYISVHPVGLSQIVWVRLVLFCAAFLCLAVYLTFTVFPSVSFDIKSHHKKLAMAATAVVMLLTLSPFVFTVNTKGEPVPGPLIICFAALVTLLLGGGIYDLIRKYKHAGSREKDQLRLALFGLGGTFGLIFFTNFLLVVVLNNTVLVPFGPTYTLVFSGCFAYAIVKHHLFDLKAAAARGLVYLLSFASIGLIYGLAIFGVLEIIGDRVTINQTQQRIFYIGFALVTTIVFPYIRRFFDRITNKFFFRETYDPQILLDEIGRIIVGDIHISSLLNKAAVAITEDIKLSYCSFVIIEHKRGKYRHLGEGKAVDDANELVNVFKKTHKPTIVRDEYDPGSAMYKLLSSNNIACAVELITHDKFIGYMLTGDKKSGNIYSGTDIKTLGIVSDELSLALDNAIQIEEIEAFNVTLQEKVQSATKELRHTNERLKELDVAKDEFISMASHQLRTPLTSVKGYISMALEGDAGKLTHDQHKLLDQSYMSAQRMVYIISDLLNVSRLKTGKFIIENAPTQLADVVETELGLLEDTAKARDIELTYDKPKKFPVLNLDDTKIRQVIMNFTDNAIYYTPDGGHIKVHLVDKGDSVEFTVVDDGLGVPKSDQHHLFSKFYRAGNARKARPDGTGLGLFMAKKVIVSQGGSIVFSSTEGKGSTFGFNFAKSKVAVPPEQLKKIK